MLDKFITVHNAESDIQQRTSGENTASNSSAVRPAQPLQSCDQVVEVEFRFAGKEKGFSLGTYPEVSLSAARDWRDEARKHIANRIDLGAERGPRLFC